MEIPTRFKPTARRKKQTNPVWDIRLKDWSTALGSRHSHRRLVTIEVDRGLKILCLPKLPSDFSQHLNHTLAFLHMHGHESEISARKSCGTSLKKSLQKNIKDCSWESSQETWCKKFHSSHNTMTHSIAQQWLGVCSASGNFLWWFHCIRSLTNICTPHVCTIFRFRSQYSVLTSYRLRVSLLSSRLFIEPPACCIADRLQCLHKRPTLYLDNKMLIICPVLVFCEYPSNMAPNIWDPFWFDLKNHHMMPQNISYDELPPTSLRLFVQSKKKK